MEEEESASDEFRVESLGIGIRVQRLGLRVSGLKDKTLKKVEW